jgi:pimeloyl-ACP methyl ester carboxylesterase
MASRFVTSTDGVRIAVHEYGDPTGPVLVAVHGFPDNHHVWDRLAAQLGDFRVVAYDVRGAGESDKPAGRSAYRISRLGDDLVAVLDAVSPGAPVHLLGHDWGSIQLWEPLSEPRLASRVATFTSISGPAPDHAGAWFRDTSHVGATLRQMLASTYVALFQVPRVPEAVLRNAPVERVAGRSFRRGVADRTNGINLYRANMPGRVLRPRPAPVSVPVLVLAPVGDPFVRVDLATQAPVPYVDDLTIEEIPGGHWVVTDDAALVAGRLRAFIEAHSTRSAQTGRA